MRRLLTVLTATCMLVFALACSGLGDLETMIQEGMKPERPPSEDYVGTWEGNANGKTSTLVITSYGWISMQNLEAGGSASYEGPAKGWGGGKLTLGIATLTYDVDIDEAPYAHDGTLRMVVAGVPLERTGPAADITPPDVKEMLGEEGPLQGVAPLGNEEAMEAQREAERTARELERIQERLDQGEIGNEPPAP